MKFPKPIKKQELLRAIQEEETIHIEKEIEGGLVLWDDKEAKALPIHFLEDMTPNSLAARIRVSESIPEKYTVDRNQLAEYMWTHSDRNAFVTMEALALFWSAPDEDEEGYVDDQLRRQLYEEYGDEYALEIADGLLGQMWFERNIAVVNVGQIVRTATEIAKENEDIVEVDAFFSLEYQVQMGVLTTVLHELRHLQMDTNPFLSEDDYPLHLGCEKEVEEYCRSVFENGSIPAKLFPFIHGD